MHREAGHLRRVARLRSRGRAGSTRATSAGRARRVAGLIALVLAASAGGSAAYLATRDGARYEELVVARVERATGRKLTVGGGLRVEWSLAPTLVLEDVAISNHPWGTRPRMVTVKRLEASFALLPLLFNEVHIRRLVAVAPDVLLERSRQGEANWTLRPDGPPGAPGAQATLFVSNVRIQGGRLELRDHRTGAVQAVESLELDGRIRGDTLRLSGRGAWGARDVSFEASLRDPKAALGNQPVSVDARIWDETTQVTATGEVGRPLELADAILHVRVQSPSAAALAGLLGLEIPGAGPLDVSGDLIRGGAGVSFDGDVQLGDVAGRIELDLGAREGAKRLTAQIDLSASSLAALGPLLGLDLPPLAPARIRGAVARRGALAELDLQIEAAEVRAAVAGRTPIPVGDGPLDLAVSLTTPSLETLGAALGRPLPPGPPVALRGKVTGRPGRWSLAELQLSAGASSLSGSVEADLTGERVRIVADLRSERLVLDDLREPRAEATAPRPAGTGRIFSTTPLPFGWLRTVDVRAAVRAQSVEAHGHRLADVSVAAELRGARLQATAAARYAGGRLRGEVTLDAGAATPELRVALRGRGSALAELANTLMERPFARGGRAEVDVDARGAGHSVAAILASLDGEARLAVGQATFDRAVLRAGAGASLLELVALIDPLGSAGDESTLECGLAQIEVRDGLATTSEAIVLETDQVLVVGRGSIDLATEQVDLGVRPRPRDGLNIGAGQLARFVRVRGPLAAPALAVDPVGVAVAGATVGAAVATGGISLLVQGLVAALVNDARPCTRPPVERTRTAREPAWTRPAAPGVDQTSASFDMMSGGP